jgi:trimethylamine--corrinoid protein Co-methyltransferase
MTGVVADVGPGGHFLKARQTRQYMRSGELYLPELMLREPYEVWRDGKKAELGRAIEAVERVLATHRAAPLPAGADAKIADVVAAAGRELGGR